MLTKYAVVCLPSSAVCKGQSMEEGQRGEVNVLLLQMQHEDHCEKLKFLGRTLIVMPANEQFPDSVFPEDPAVILQGDSRSMYIVTRLAHKTRSGEEPILKKALAEHFSDFREITNGTIEGGDVLVTPNGLYVGLSGRTDMGGATQLAEFAKESFGLSTKIFPIPESWLHLKGGVSYHGGWKGQRPVIIVSEEIFEYFLDSRCDLVKIPKNEHYKHYGPNCVSEGKEILIHKGSSTAKRLLENIGFSVQELDLGEFWKIDGAMSCLSKLFVSSITP